MTLPRLMLVTDPAYGDETIASAVLACARALPAGFFAVQLRDKKRAPEALRAFALRLRAITKDAGAWLVINGNAELARDIGADGVHLGGDAMRVRDARRILGESTFVSIAAHSDQAVRAGIADGANAALVSAIFASPGKAMGRGIGALESARALALAKAPDFAIYALGGIDASNARACIAAGAAGIAVIRAILLSPDPAERAREFYSAFADADARRLDDADERSL